ncbi:hypothetical protein B0H65DRAFT_514821 [Neurospora tetraspora]|uniref:CFEM domain-containing protein n=1 Tax=Neurospora tetraspora TaxID=94610 RepID=A0AAE0JNY1_9PEZI|nr:hypothetical protein B0H65DRAFT_514821 [Neurospora tetraspora]
MKYSASLLAFAASAAATFPFHNAPAFTCPQNTDNKCTDQQKTGFAFDDLSAGPFSQYMDFNFNGWTSGAGFGGRFGKRTFKGISGVCGSDKSKAPSFGAGDKFSLGSIHVTPEFDCDLEFHYHMPDGSTCKHRNQCTKGGTNVVNKQCGGATNVTIIYPPQPEKPKPSCSVIISTISFDCSTKQSTVPPKTKTTNGASTTSAAATSSVPSVPAETTSTSAAPVASSSAPAESVPGSQTSTAPAEITSAPSAPVESTPAENVPILTTSAPISEVVSAPPVTSTIVTSFDSTSTIFVTEIQTITSCAPTVTNCPATTTVVTIATSTTVCPVTETHTTVISATSSAAPVASSEGPSEIVISTSIGDIISAPAGSTSSAAAVESSAVASSAVASSAVASSAAVSSAVESSTGVVVPTSAGSVASSSAAAVDTTSSAAPVSTAPVEPLPCPGVVPSCLNTFLFETGCTDNSDAACYCPNALFVKNVYECIYAHGESESIISEAITFFQGICAPYVNTNPGIATGVPTYVTSTAAPTSVAPVFTTITVNLTTVVPCTDEAGSTIASSSTTVIVDTTMTVPQIHFTSTTDDVAIVPAPTGVPLVTETEAVPVVSATVTKTGAVGVSTSAAAPVNSAPAVTSAPAVPIGTAVGTGGLVRPSSSVISPPIVTAGSGRVNAGLGLAVAVVLGALAL